jgi:glycosyltransferase involved in cell wall biosynthesis
MPAYNVATYIAEAMESVLAQTFRDFELLVVDDGATDETHAIAAGIAERDPRVRVLRKENGGLSSARNHALRCATGEFIALLDSDDRWEPAFLDAQVAILRRRADVALVTGNGRNLGGPRHGQTCRPYPDPRPEPDLATIIADDEAVFIMTVFRRTVYERIGGFDESMRSNEDYDYWMRAALAGFRFARNDVPLGDYRRRPDSISASEVRMLRGILAVLHKHAPIIRARPGFRMLMERQITGYEARLLAAEARSAIEDGRFEDAAARLAALHTRRPELRVGLARFMARWTPKLLSRAYTIRRSRQVT